MLIFSDNGVPDRTAAILSGEEEPVYDRLLYGAKLLEQGGCTAIAVPCNTAHYFLDKVQEQISIPILHMVREACQVLASRGCHYPGVLGTDGTIQTGIYQKELIALGMEPRVPSPEAQKKVMSIIYDDIKAGKAGDPEKFAVVHQDLEEQGVRLRHPGLHRAVGVLQHSTTCPPSTWTPWRCWPSGPSRPATDLCAVFSQSRGTPNFRERQPRPQ